MSCLGLQLMKDPSGLEPGLSEAKRCAFFQLLPNISAPLSPEGPASPRPLPSEHRAGTRGLSGEQVGGLWGSPMMWGLRSGTHHKASLRKYSRSCSWARVFSGNSPD